MSATLQSTRSALLSKTAVPFFIQGTATDPVFKPDLQGMAKTQTKDLIQSEAQKRLGDKAGAAATGILDSLSVARKSRRNEPRAGLQS
jgi:hypothetical protein